MSVNQEQMNIVIVGHVDHGKSTFIGRLLADTGSLPEGKLEQVQATCKKNAKPFEYAFLLDALKDEQAQGITIDSARCFFKSQKRHYIVIDAPGHIEFLKNMVTGAARAEAALLLIDAKEGVKENSRRHGFLLSMLGIKQVIVLVNKMDLIDYNQEKYDAIVNEYTQFLKEINVSPKAFVPIAAFHGENMITHSSKMKWYQGLPVLELVDEFKKEENKIEKAFRFPVQDIYKFTEEGDERRIVAGTIDSGKIKVGDEVVFFPSKKTSKIKSIENFNTSQKTEAYVGQAPGFTLETQIYIKPGEIMCKAGQSQPEISYALKVNVFWLGKQPMILNKRYKLKLGALRQTVFLKEILKIMDASDLSSSNQKSQIDRHDVAECILQSNKPLAFDKITENEGTGRFVIVDDYEISGGGIITEGIKDSHSHTEDDLKEREYLWERGKISVEKRIQRFNQTPKLVIITGNENTGKKELAMALEERLFNEGKNAYYLGISNLLLGLGLDLKHKVEDRDEHIRRLGEIAHLFTDSGQIVISSISLLEDDELNTLKILNHPRDVLVIAVGQTSLETANTHCTLKETDSLEKKLEECLSFFKRNMFTEYEI